MGVTMEDKRGETMDWVASEFPLMLTCSNCNGIYVEAWSSARWHFWKYCPVCGAKRVIKDEKGEDDGSK